MKILLCLFVVLAPIAALASEERLSDAQIRLLLLQDSIANSLSDCPCPYSVKRNGASCRDESLYVHPRGRMQLCYDHDVTDAMVQAYRREHGLR